MDNGLILALTFVVSLELVFADYCTAYNYWGSSYRTFHCSFGCCGPVSEQYCCAGSAGAIVGMVLGGICAVAVVFTIICCCVKQHNHKGQIIQQAPTAGTYVTSHTTSENIFVVPTGGPQALSSPYPVQYNHAYGAAGRPASFPAPPAYRQPGVPLPPGYNQTGILQPPTYNQTGILQAPTYNETGILQPPGYNQTGILQPPTYNQTGILQAPSYNQTGILQSPTYNQASLSPPTYSQADTLPTTYNSNSSNNKNTNNDNDSSDVDPQPNIPPMTKSGRT